MTTLILLSRRAAAIVLFIQSYRNGMDCIPLELPPFVSIPVYPLSSLYLPRIDRLWNCGWCFMGQI